MPINLTLTLPDGRRQAAFAPLTRTTLRLCAARADACNAERESAHWPVTLLSRDAASLAPLFARGFRPALVAGRLQMVLQEPLAAARDGWLVSMPAHATVDGREVVVAGKLYRVSKGRVKVDAAAADAAAARAAAWDVGELLRVVEDGRHTIDAGAHLLTAAEALEALRQQLPTGAELSLAADSITRPIDLARDGRHGTRRARRSVLWRHTCARRLACPAQRRPNAWTPFCGRMRYNDGTPHTRGRGETSWRTRQHGTRATRWRARRATARTCRSACAPTASAAPK